MRTGIHDANDDPLIMKVDRGGCPDDVGTAVGADGRADIVRATAAVDLHDEGVVVGVVYACPQTI